MNETGIARYDPSFKFTQEQIELLKRTVCKKATNDEFVLFRNLCEKRGLDPFTHQIHAIKRKIYNEDTERYDEIMTFQTGIDGYRLIAERTGCYAPGRATIFEYNEGDSIRSATAYVKKLVAGTWHEVSGTAFWNEYVQKRRDGKPTRFWNNMPHSQIAKCAEAIALRRAFPEELSGFYVNEEMQQADNQIKECNEVPSEPAVVEPPVDDAPAVEEDPTKRIDCLARFGKAKKVMGEKLYRELLVMYSDKNSSKLIPVNDRNRIADMMATKYERIKTQEPERLEESLRAENPTVSIDPIRQENINSINNLITKLGTSDVDTLLVRIYKGKYSTTNIDTMTDAEIQDLVYRLNEMWNNRKESALLGEQDVESV